jgi:hypothetical protein
MSAGELIITDGLSMMDWALQPLQSRRSSAAGASAVVTYGPSRWRLRVETDFLTLTQARRWSAWLARREGGRFTFTAWRLFRRYPLGSLGVEDSPDLLSVDYDNSRLVLGSVGPYQARQGDMVSYRTAANGYWAGEIVADLDAVAGEIPITVRPKPVLPHATTPSVRRVTALAEFELSTDLDPFEDYSQRRLSFEALQVLR